MTRLPLLLLLGCDQYLDLGPVQLLDSEPGSEIDPNWTPPTECASARWEWDEVNATADVAEASYVGGGPGAYATTVGTPGDLNGDGGNDLFVIAEGENDGAGELYFLLGGVRRVLGQPLEGRPSIIGDSEDNIGLQVHAAGDLDDDGLQDIFHGPTGTNRAHVIFGSKGNWPVAARLADSDVTFTHTDAEGRTDDLASLGIGDYDGDGGDDLLLRGLTPAGSELHAIRGVNVADLHSVPRWGDAWVTGGLPLGTGDFNGDGLTDVLLEVGYTPTRDQLFSSGCQVILGEDLEGAYNRPSDELARVLKFRTQSTCKVIPDFNGDGKDDIIALPTTRVPDAWVYVFTNVDSWTDTVELGVAAAGLFVGDLIDVFALQDMNGDGMAEIAFTRALTPETYASHVFFGREAWTGGATMGWATVEIEPGFLFPRQGDINGDGYPDLLANVPDGSAPEGLRTSVYLGGPDWNPQLTAAKAHVVFEGTQSWAAFQDVDGDGCDDIVGTSDGHDKVGEVSVVFGQYFKG